jgi:hypothetical protein
VKIYYKNYCNILTWVIREAKCIHYNKQISKSDNRVRTIWKIVKDETGKHSTEEENPSIKVNNSVINSPKLIQYLFPNNCRKTEQQYKEPNRGRGNTILDQNNP